MNVSDKQADHPIQFTGFITRMRGYHAQAHELPGYLDGKTNSYYYAPQSHARMRKSMQQYHAVEPPYWQREFPIAWRDIDLDVPRHPHTASLVSSSELHGEGSSTSNLASNSEHPVSQNDTVIRRQ